MGCISVSPAVSELEKTWTDGQILQLEMEQAASREFGASVGFVSTPSFILFDGTGNIVKRWARGAPALAELP
jgi:hypothetical protein